MVALLLIVAVATAVRGLWSPCGLSMLSSLNPVSERARGHRFWLTAAWYVAGAAAGGALLGGGLAAFAYGYGRVGAPAAVGWGLALAAAAVAVASDVRLAGWSLPDNPRQVDERWLARYRRWIYAAGYGGQIGTGFATYIMTAGVYLLAVLAVLTGDPASAFAGGLVFGVVRGSAIAVAARARDPERLRALLARVDGLAPASALFVAVVLAGAGTAAAWALAGPALAAPAGVALLLCVAQASEARAMVALARRTAMRPVLGSTSSTKA